jgi:hypothetical protein
LRRAAERETPAARHGRAAHAAARATAGRVHSRNAARRKSSDARAPRPELAAVPAANDTVTAAERRRPASAHHARTAVTGRVRRTGVAANARRRDRLSLARGAFDPHAVAGTSATSA